MSVSPLSSQTAATESPGDGWRQPCCGEEGAETPRGGKQPALSRVPVGHLRFAFTKIVWRARRGSGALWDGSLLAHREVTAEEGSWGGVLTNCRAGGTLRVETARP